MSYPNWIGSLNLKTENEAEFFYKFLEEIIPYDPPVFLKVQVNKVSEYFCILAQHELLLLIINLLFT